MDTNPPKRKTIIDLLRVKMGEGYSYFVTFSRYSYRTSGQKQFVTFGYVHGLNISHWILKQYRIWCHRTDVDDLKKNHCIKDKPTVIQFIVINCCFYTVKKVINVLILTLKIPLEYTILSIPINGLHIMVTYIKNFVENKIV